MTLCWTEAKQRTACVAPAQMSACSATSAGVGKKAAEPAAGTLERSLPPCGGDSREAGGKRQEHSGLTVWLAPQATSRTTTLGTGRICPSFVFSMKMATRRGTSSQSYSIRCARAMNFPSELCPVVARARCQQWPQPRAPFATAADRAPALSWPAGTFVNKAAFSNLRHSPVRGCDTWFVG